MADGQNLPAQMTNGKAVLLGTMTVEGFLAYTANVLTIDAYRDRSLR